MQGQVVVVTGCASGIGRTTARMFAELGAVIIGIDVDGVGNASLLEELSAAGAQAEMFEASVGDKPAIAAIAADVIGRRGAIQVLFNNAATLSWSSTEKTTDQEWDQLVQVNLGGAFVCTREFLPGLKRAEGASIIHHCSIDGVFGNPLVPSYSASKGGMIPMTHVMAHEFGPLGIRVNCLATGGVLTGMSDGVSDDYCNRVIRATPLGRFGKPEEVAAVVVFLASAAASYISGAVITIDGGRTGLTHGEGVA